MSSPLLVYLLLLFLPHGSLALICYSCTTTLSSSVDENAQVALRLFLNSVYELPSVHRFCNVEQDVEFKTIPTIQCSTPNDQCVKVRAENEGMEFVIRGCKSKLYKPDVSIPQNLQCKQDSPSLCFCKENLCNSTPINTKRTGTMTMMMGILIGITLLPTLISSLLTLS